MEPIGPVFGRVKKHVFFGIFSFAKSSDALLAKLHVKNFFEKSDFLQENFRFFRALLSGGAKVFFATK